MLMILNKAPRPPSTHKLLSMLVARLLVFAVTLSGTCWARDYTFTIKLARGTSECFYDYIHEGAFLEIEYQVSWRSKNNGELQTIRCDVCLADSII